MNSITVSLKNQGISINFFNEVKLYITRSVKIDPSTKKHDLYYPCSIYGPDLLFGNLRVVDNGD